MEGLRTDQLRHAISQLHFTARAFFHARQMADHFGHQHIAADDGQVGRRFLNRRLFHQALYGNQPPEIFRHIQHAITVHAVTRHFFNRDNIAAGFAIGIGQLRGTGYFALHQIIGQ